MGFFTPGYIYPSESHFNYADLSNSNFAGAIFIEASFNGANFRGSNFNGTIFIATDLRDSKDLEFSESYPPLLCATKLPSYIELDPNRDCERIVMLMLAIEEEANRLNRRIGFYSEQEIREWLKWLINR